MKARVIATGKIVEVKPCEEWTTMHGEILTYISDEGVYYPRRALSFKIDDEKDEQFDYWTRLEHQYAGMAMQGILSNQNIVYKDISTETICNHVAERVKEIAQALVEKMKEADR